MVHGLPASRHILVSRGEVCRNKKAPNFLEATPPEALKNCNSISFRMSALAEVTSVETNIHKSGILSKFIFVGWRRLELHAVRFYRPSNMPCVSSLVRKIRELNSYWYYPALFSKQVRQTNIRLSSKCGR